MGDTGMGPAPTPWLQGVWRREVRAVPGQPMSEVSTVVWAQVGTWFADVREPHRDGEHLSYLDEAQAFSGVVRCNGGTVTWRHDLDTRPRPPGHEDSATVELQGEVLIERGADYEERWRRDDRPGPVAVWAGRRPGGATLHFVDDGWEIETCVGAGAIPWPAVLATRSGRVPTGWGEVTPTFNKENQEQSHD